MLDHPVRSQFFFNPSGRWSIEIPLGELLPTGAEFNVFVADASFPTFDHRTSLSNISFDITRLDHPDLNGNPFARVWAYEQIPAGPAALNNHPFAVAYDAFTERWVILNTDGADFAEDVRFVVGFLSTQIFEDGFETGDLSAWSAAVP